MTVTELESPFVTADFEQGDRVYCLYDGSYTKGTVIAHRPGTVNCVTVAMDNDWETIVHIPSQFKKGSSWIGYWGKIPDISQFKKGTVISKMEDDGIRRFATISFVVPGQEIKMNITTFPWGERDYRVSDGINLEDQFFDWEIEG